MFRFRPGFLSIFFLLLIFIFTADAWAKKPACGDGTCNGSETAATCPDDCSAPPPSECNFDGTCDTNETADSCSDDCYCGNGSCEASETYDTCPDDCDPPPPSSCNNDGICNAGEDCLNCPNDCAGVTSGKPSGRFCCGVDTCDAGMCGPDCGASADPYCGDGIVDPGEQCDTAGQTAVCDIDCTLPVCGDGTLNTSAGETCDDGVETATCDADCTAPVCGDGTLNTSAGETCDDGVETATCDADCTAPVCGDGITNELAGEECDDEGDSPYCDYNCTFSICGDGYTNSVAAEECDTSGETAACDIDCTFSECGDGYTNSLAGEECDDGNNDSGDGCSAVCMIETPPAPFCGDGHIDPGEECDDGNNDSGDGCSAVCTIETPVSAVPSYQFNIGDSIGEGEAADGTIGSSNHETVWSTGYNAGDSVNSLNERFETIDSVGYFENDASSDAIFNRAISGSIMADFEVQAQEIVDAISAGPLSFSNGMITILLGNNDVCAPTLDDMTDRVLFEEQYRAGLTLLANNAETRDAHIHISGIPAIYWLWNAKRSSWWCRLLVWPNVPCENLLSSPTDDCASTASRLDPDNFYTGDGSNCIRRKNFHAKIRDIYNPILQEVLQDYIDDGRLPNAEFIDVFNVQFSSEHVNGGDCFHPSEAGHSLLSDAEWCPSKWENGEFSCEP